MKRIFIGLANSSAKPPEHLLHDQCYISSPGDLRIRFFLLSEQQIKCQKFGNPIAERKYSGLCFANNNTGKLVLKDQTGKTIFSFTNKNQDQYFAALFEPEKGPIIIKQRANGPVTNYKGTLLVIAEQNHLRLVLCHSLEDYVLSVLQGEISPSFQYDAIKAQALCARTYALRPRVDHSQDFCNVCDSHLCCQCFSELSDNTKQVFKKAVLETQGEIITSDEQPILALFSSSAGGYTNNYEDCFSDWLTDEFPPKILPYLKGTSESFLRQKNKILTEDELRQLWNKKDPATADGWAKNFKWSFTFTQEDLESHVHHNLAVLLKQKSVAPYIIPARSGLFGEIQAIAASKRSNTGNLISLLISTSKGDWLVSKELNIRNVFQNLKPNLKRLPSAKFFWDSKIDGRSGLSSLNIYGFGSGHGVGLQQMGAQGWAVHGKNYRDIIAHYYQDTQIDKI